jgi:hypothetical protein
VGARHRWKRPFVLPLLAVQTLRQIDKDVRPTMKGMVRSGLLTRREAGRYVVASPAQGSAGRAHARSAARPSPQQGQRQEPSPQKQSEAPR